MGHFIYSDRFNQNWADHIFPVEKYSLVRRRLITERLAAEGDFVAARSATEAELLLVHQPQYLARIKQMTMQPDLGYMEFEAPLTEDALTAFLYATGGSIQACELAAGGGWAMNLSGGFHHAFADHGEGFCVFNDVAVAIRAAMTKGLFERVLVVDCDLHQGNGTARIFRDEKRVFTFSIHQENNYPLKQKSDCDVGLDDYTTDETYLAALQNSLPRIFERFRPDLVFYLAGADPFREDKLGTLMLSKQGLMDRDRLVLSMASAARASVAVVLAGGYARDTADVVDIHVNTARLLFEILGSKAAPGPSDKD